MNVLASPDDIALQSIAWQNLAGIFLEGPDTRSSVRNQLEKPRRSSNSVLNTLPCSMLYSQADAPQTHRHLQSRRMTM